MVHLQGGFDQKKLQDRYKLELVPLASSKQANEDAETTESQDILQKQSAMRKGEIYSHERSSFKIKILCLNDSGGQQWTSRG
jgi:hypothetical protein